MTVAAAEQQQPQHPMLPQQGMILPDTRMREEPRFVFFAGDHISPAEKYLSPNRFMGGVELDMFLTLKETGKELFARPDFYNTGGMLYRCAIHQLKTYMYPVNPNMVPPADRDPDAGKFVPGYVKQNGRRNPATGQYEDVVVSGGMLYRPFYPGDEIESLTRPSNGLRPGGIVEIQALRGKGWKEQYEAQIHFFPNWEALQVGTDVFPLTLKELRDSISAKIPGASPFLAEIGRDMLRSCDEFRLWGLRYIKAWRQIVKFADASIDAPLQGYNDLCEMLFDLLQVNREDTLGQNQQQNVTDVAVQIGQQIASAITRGMTPQEAARVVGDPMEGIAAVDETPGVIIPKEADTPNQEAIDGLTGEQIPQVQTITTTGNDPASNPDLNSQTALGAQAAEAVIKVGSKVTIAADGRIGLVTWKGPNDKLKLSFEDGGSELVDKSEVIANA